MIKKGDKVRVTRKPTKEELVDIGLDWVHPKNAKVGGFFTVLSYGVFGARIDDISKRRKKGFHYPLCVLEKVEE